jgi:membrane-associated protein
VDWLATPLDLLTHFDVHLRQFVADHGAWVYALLFCIVFAETGLLVLPFLPGDALLFVVGAFCGVGLMSLPLSMLVLTTAAIAGNQTNYAVGRYFGPRVFRWERSRFFNRAAFDMAHAYYERHGGITIVIARFVPLLRSFAPFVAGVARMRRDRFTFFDVSGGALWVVSLTLAGYWFGNIAWVQRNFDRIILALLAMTVLIAVGGRWGAKRAQRSAGRA